MIKKNQYLGFPFIYLCW